MISYLLVDTYAIPLILDQANENLDNEPACSMSVPIIRYAKEHRQIVMAVHNAQPLQSAVTLSKSFMPDLTGRISLY
ncbi:energy-coupling factor transporter ATP-binding protein EcfA2 [Paraburkholderia sp. WC7.3g]|uniref:Uncharacterized protein n=1 Tax=Paraburkholderia podalyriae TaxID=1938811 RepID=A0ABR7PI75_9BURK|nr:hypothetical protein [Paraburkholderia podalyriae]MBC8746021.1 hypothetical protein [Paraburkholderia podalyriae]